ncbi:MAG: hypothetical protein WCS99_10635 [Limisphaerales bacterium]
MPTIFLTCATPGLAAWAATETNIQAAAISRTPNEAIEVLPNFFIKPLTVARFIQFPRLAQRIGAPVKVNPRFPVGTPRAPSLSRLCKAAFRHKSGLEHFSPGTGFPQMDRGPACPGLKMVRMSAARHLFPPQKVTTASKSPRVPSMSNDSFIQSVTNPVHAAI